MAALCGLESWIGIQRNDSAAYINDILLAVINGSSAIFAFLSNLAIIVTIIKAPSLQKPCNILLCSLASVDCLTGVTAQPMFVVWRLFLQRAQQSCLHQVLAFDVYYTLHVLTVGLSLVNVLVISFDRHYALARPLEYMTSATKTGAVKVTVFANIIWLLSTILLLFILPSLPGFIFVNIFGVVFVIVPPVNYIRVLFSIRRHNAQLGDAVTPQMSTVFQREKKVAHVMCIVTILLFASLSPALSMSTVQKRYPLLHSILFPWSLTMSFIPSSTNPVIYFGRNKNMRNTFKSIMNI